MKNPASSRAKGLIAKIHSEGYCCLNGYLGLCRARGETPQAMAEFIGVSPDAIWHHYRRLKQGKIPCQQHSDCLTPIVEAIQKEKAP